MRSEGHAVESVCRVLREQGCQIAARTYRAVRSGRRGLCARTVSDAQTVEAIRQVAWATDSAGRQQLAPEGLYGRRKMYAHLRRSELEVTAGAVDRGMRLLGLSGVVRGKPHRTTIADHSAGRAPDLLNRDFTAAAPNLKWVTDFTYVRSWSGFVYVAFILDVYAQRIIAWHAQTTKTVDLASIPLRMAIWERDRQGHPAQKGELIHHSDAGSQYTAIRYTENLVLQQIRPSIGSVGDAYDNALMECINGLYKTECIRTQVFHRGPYRTIGDVEYATAGWVDWYNNRRLHSSLGMVPPAEHEQAYYAALNREQQPV
jgi:putative transposase